ncbi:MAG: Rne/Rng family ribonuclease [Acidobacteriota bacterium]
MSKEMVISVNGREKKIAILDNGRVTEFYIERGEENSGIAGNIYKGRVQRVLPGMQSAFVSIGLERDAFLYVSDFFDEEEEIERIVMEKSKKGSAEDLKREADERIDRARVEREKQMESAQELAEPLAESVQEAETERVPADTKGRERKGRGRGRKEAPPSESDGAIREQDPAFVIEDSGFERIVDEEDTGEMFKDAYRQEAIVDQVRAVEFDLESTSSAEVGSLIASVTETPSEFERIADEDEDQSETKPKKPSKGRAAKGGRKTSSASEAEGTSATDTNAPAAKSKSTRSKTGKAKPARSKSKKSDDTSAETFSNADASVSESPETAEMTVRRGGRGRRRGGGRTRRSENGDTVNGEGSEAGPESVDETEQSEEILSAADVQEAPEQEEKPEAPAEPVKEARGAGKSGDSRETRGRGERRDSRDSRSKNYQGENGKGRDRNDRNDRRDRPAQPTISDLLREGQEILVQIAKEPIARKGARITSHIALPGRYLVYMPTIEHLGVSRKIESSSERGRLRTLIQRIRQDEVIPSGGFIVRTAGVGIAEEDLRQDARYLVRTWLDIKKNSEKAKSPAMVHQDLDIVQRLLRDQLSDEFTAIRVDSEEEYLRTVEFINRMQPKMVNRVKLYTREDPILEAYGVQEEVDKALKPRVWLKSGGYLVINQTEALVAIDVNTGKFVGKGNARLEDTITRTNMEAVDEIARQIRLRDLGGIIVLDLIDMEDRRNRHKVSQALQEALQDDKSPTKVLSFNDFGLIIMTRKRVKQSLERTMCAPCEYCDGAGWVKSPQTVCYEILSEARRLSRQMDDVRQTTLRIHPDVAKAIRSSERAVLEEIEAYLGNVDLTADPAIHQEQFDFAFI